MFIELSKMGSKRGKGVGHRLLQVVKEEAINRDCSRLSLLDGRDTESYDRSFYKKLGFRERSEMANYIIPLPKSTDR
ncbi:MAG: GNAT family N-acetyltransferase [Halobacteriota archaeon]|nr:GNAT family N-acetyltransferase [Halobacteriota archaeon]